MSPTVASRRVVASRAEDASLRAEDDFNAATMPAMAAPRDKTAVTISTIDFQSDVVMAYAGTAGGGVTLNDICFEATSLTKTFMRYIP